MSVLQTLADGVYLAPSGELVIVGAKAGHALRQLIIDRIGPDEQAVVIEPDRLRQALAALARMKDRP
jgi:hypothetical protein